MMEFLPVLIVGAIIGAFAIVFIMAYIALTKKKEELPIVEEKEIIK